MKESFIPYERRVFILLLFFFQDMKDGFSILCVCMVGEGRGGQISWQRWFNDLEKWGQIQKRVKGNE